MQALLVQDALKRQEPYLQIKPLMHLLFISASTNIHTDYYFSYQRTQEFKAESSSRGKARCHYMKLNTSKAISFQPFLLYRFGGFTHTVFRKILIMFKSKSIWNAANTFFHICMCHNIWPFCSFLQHCKHLFISPKSSANKRRQNKPTHPFYSFKKHGGKVMGKVLAIEKGSCLKIYRTCLAT